MSSRAQRRIFSTVSAEVYDAGGFVSTILDWFVIKDLTEQVDKVINNKDGFPDFLGLWIGHNNVDWAIDLKDKTISSKNRKTIFDKIRKKFITSYRKELLRLVQSSENKKNKIGKNSAIVVYGLVNFESFFRARNKCKNIRNQTPNAENLPFPFLDKSEDIFKSLKDKYSEGMIQLAQLINSDLKSLVSSLSKSYEGTYLSYSKALSKGAVESCDMLHPLDAWHLSNKGKSVESGYILDDAEQALRFINF